MHSQPKKSSGLKALPLWQAMLYPVILMLVAMNTWTKDRLISFLPKRRFSKIDLESTFLKAGHETRQVLTGTAVEEK
ncbi:MAG: hypothetical protein EOP07_07240 [Proteobacteria bacterium]|nr:MAG: hypothetical protein EOP07_07240 [Pseudomonadota bacterium]